MLKHITLVLAKLFIEGFKFGARKGAYRHAEACPCLACELNGLTRNSFLARKFRPAKVSRMSIKHLIRERGLKQAEIAGKLGVSEPTFSRWVNHGVPGDAVPRVAEVTGIPAAALRPDLAAAFGQHGTRAASEPAAPEAA